MQNFFDPASWSYAENPSFSFSDSGTLSPEMPSASFDLSPTINVSVGNVNTDNTLTGALGFARATADGLLGAWQTFEGFKRSAAEMDLQRQIAAGEIAVRSAQATSAQEIAKLTAETSASVEKARAAAAVSVAQQKADAAKNGTVYVPAASSLSLPVIVAGLALAYVVLNRGKK